MSHILTEEDVRQHLNVPCPSLTVFDTVDSTNAYLKREALSGTPHGSIAIANAHSAGRGRLGRSFQSPEGKGLYLSVLLRPHLSGEELMRATGMAAVAARHAIRRTCGAEVGIKWVNDLVLNGKKICGMLAECGFKGDMCDWIAMGLGLNLRRDALPEELIYASSIEAETGKILAAEEIIESFLPVFDALQADWEREGLAPVIERMLPLSATVGRDVRVDGVYAKALAIDTDGALVCEFEDGVRRVLAGDVSVRGITDYV